MHAPHELAEDFPNQAETIHHLKETDGHFRALAERYAEVNHAVHRAETRLDTVTEEEEHKLRHERSVLKDQIAAALTAADPAGAGA